MAQLLKNLVGHKYMYYSGVTFLTGFKKYPRFQHTSFFYVDVKMDTIIPHYWKKTYNLKSY